MEATCSAGICGESDIGASEVVMTGEIVRWGMTRRFGVFLGFRELLRECDG